MDSPHNTWTHYKTHGHTTQHMGTLHNTWTHHKTTGHTTQHMDTPTYLFHNVYRTIRVNSNTGSLDDGWKLPFHIVRHSYSRCRSYTPLINKLKHSSYQHTVHINTQFDITAFKNRNISVNKYL